MHYKCHLLLIWSDIEASCAAQLSCGVCFSPVWVFFFSFSLVPDKLTTGSTASVFMGQLTEQGADSQDKCVWRVWLK